MSAVPIPGLVRIAVADLLPNPLNPRRVVGDVSELAESIRANGLLQPLLVEHKPGPLYMVVAGHRRLEAAKRLGLATVPCRMVNRLSPADLLAAMVVENGQRRGLDPIEEARAIDHLMRTGSLTQLQVAQRIGKSQTHVSQRLTLLELTPEEQEQVRTRELRVQDAIQKGRVAKGTHEQTRFTGWHLGKTHPLADQVKAVCIEANHSIDRRVGGVGCGACWEAVIRSDERNQS